MELWSLRRSESRIRGLAASTAMRGLPAGDGGDRGDTSMEFGAGVGRAISAGHSRPSGQWSESHWTTAMAERMVTRPLAQRSNQVLDPAAMRARVEVAIRRAPAYRSASCRMSDIAYMRLSVACMRFSCKTRRRNLAFVTPKRASLADSEQDFL